MVARKPRTSLDATCRGSITRKVTFGLEGEMAGSRKILNSVSHLIRISAPSTRRSSTTPKYERHSQKSKISTCRSRAHFSIQKNPITNTRIQVVSPVHREGVHIHEGGVVFTRPKVAAIHGASVLLGTFHVHSVDVSSHRKGEALLCECFEPPRLSCPI